MLAAAGCVGPADEAVDNEPGAVTTTAARTPEPEVVATTVTVASTTTSATTSSSPAPETTTTTSTTQPTTTTSTSITQPTTTTSTSTTSTTVVPTTTTSSSDRFPLDTGDVLGFEVIEARLGDRSLLLALADTPTLRSRGLMGVESMGDLHGMVFAWETPLEVAFWMKNTLIPLDIGFFDPDGALFEVLSMTPCTADPCPTYPSSGPVRWALEALPGFFEDVGRGEVLTLGQSVPRP